MLRNQFKKKHQEKIILAMPSNGACIPFDFWQSSSNLSFKLCSQQRLVDQSSLETGPLGYENMVHDRDSFKKHWWKDGSF